MKPVILIFALLLVLGGCETATPLDQIVGGAGAEPAADRPGKATDKMTAADQPGGEAITEPTDSTPTGDSADRNGSAELSSVQVALLEAAREVLATQSTVVGDTTYSYDCSGTILTVYDRAGIRLIDLFVHYSGNGVARLYGISRDYSLLHTRDLPEPGDLIFWDNTYDRNGDGQWNDPLTHAGMVLSVDEDGTVEYLHHNYRQGIVTASMNLLEPETYQTGSGSVMNSPMRMASQRSANPDLWLASHLFREFSSMHRIGSMLVSTGGEAIVASAR